jgi:hypothetical protein
LDGDNAPYIGFGEIRKISFSIASVTIAVFEIKKIPLKRYNNPEGKVKNGA